MKKKEIKSFREAAKLLIPENYLSILIIYYYPDYDHCEGIHYEGGEKVKRVGPKGLLRMATESFQKYGVGYLGPPKTLQELERFATDILDSEWSQSRFVSPKDYLKEKEQKEHDACNDLATSIVQQYAVKNGTLGLIAACHKHYNQLARNERRFREDPEVRMERWAAHMYEGTRDAFWEDNDYSASQEASHRDKLDRLIRYFKRYTPLLWAQWEERRLRNDKRNRNQKGSKEV